jgi:hypothetical protein
MRLSSVARFPSRPVLVGFLAAGFLTVFAAPAFAHHPIVSGTVECAENGHQIITWTVSNSETVSGTNRTMTLDQVHVSSGSVSGIGVGTAFPPSALSNSTRTATTDLPGDQTGNVTLQVRGDWSSGGPQNVSVTSDPVHLKGECEDTTSSSSTTTTTEATTTTTTQAAVTTTTTQAAVTTTTTQAAVTTTTLAPAAVVAPTTASTVPTQVLGVTLTAPAPAAELPRTGSPIGSTVSVGLIALLLGGLALRLARSTKKAPTV